MASEGLPNLDSGKEGNELGSSDLEIAIDPKVMDELSIIAQRVGGDFGMEIKVGKPGEGSFFDNKNVSITFDPLHFQKGLETIKFIAGHEGAHRAITPSPEKLGLTKEKVRELYSQVGFGYLQNIIEDPAVNDWLKERFPGFKSYVKETYDKLLESENAVLSTPEVVNIARQLGYWPKFAKYGSEIIRHWHQGKFASDLDPDVKKALERTLKNALKSIESIPNPKSWNEREILERSSRRFEINTDYIWPEFKKLVEMDLHTEELRQMLNDFQEKRDGLKQKQEQLKNAQKAKDQETADRLSKEIERLKKELEVFDEMDQKSQEELQDKMEQALKKASEELNQEIQGLKDQLEQSQARQEELQDEIDKLQEQLKNAESGDEKETSQKQLQEKQEELLGEQKNQEELEQRLEEIQDALEQTQSGEAGMPFPDDQFSEETKQELEKLFSKLPRSKKESLRDKAKERLEEFEDTLNKEFEKKLNEDQPESHRERHLRERGEEEREKRNQEYQDSLDDLQRKFEELRRGEMTEYDKAYEEVAPIINDLYLRLRKFFLPERHPKWEKGYPTGQRLDLGKAMQAEADPRHLTKLWERKTIPTKFDYRFSILVDLSGSMEGEKGEKIKETFKGLVVLAEVLEKLKIKYNIIGFSVENRILKGFKDKLDPDLRNKLSLIKSLSSPFGNDTATGDATLKAIDEIKKDQGKDNFIITLTDGQPNRGASLREVLNEIEEKKLIKTVGVGLGPDTEFVEDDYKAALSVKNIGDFSKAFADLLEDLIKNPQKYQ